MAEHAGSEHTAERLRRFSDAASTHRLEFLKAIEEKLDALALEHRYVSTLIDNGELLIESLECSPASEAIDPLGELAAQLETVEGGIRNEAIGVLSEKRDAAVRDPQLRGDYEDGIVSAYDDLISLMGRLHDVTVNLRWAVMEHDADLEEPAGESFSSPSDLVRSIAG